MPRTRRNNNALSPTQPECVNKICSICMVKISTGQAAIKLENERKCYHTKCISDYQNRRYDLVTPHRNQFSQNDIDRMNRFRRAMRSRSMSRSRSRSRSNSSSSRSRSSPSMHSNAYNAFTQFLRERENR
jgi:hypothetical protein